MVEWFHVEFSSQTYLSHFFSASMLNLVMQMGQGQDDCWTLPSLLSKDAATLVAARCLLVPRDIAGERVTGYTLAVYYNDDNGICISLYVNSSGKHKVFDVCSWFVFANISVFTSRLSKKYMYL